MFRPVVEGWSEGGDEKDNKTKVWFLDLEDVREGTDGRTGRTGRTRRDPPATKKNGREEEEEEDDEEEEGADTRAGMSARV